ncbi:glycosyltransferase family 4 protein [Motilibacter aurantiacus]|uniref:glycosyltransferase family 4 protein n=1 Tax=Motilibacter aurantiacus TaxID=2714955 RepID=UPI00140BDC19|nr:glycosyltransferase family 4 protein [Motilibacter aurantiacus]NHC44733.1 glycosyltransferase family 4 protein [Motilibacter aurantiacus]
MTRLHLVYPHGEGIRTPDAIGRQLAQRLSKTWDVVLHDWDAPPRTRPERGDVLVGHPHPSPGTALRRLWKDPRWSGRFVLCPYAGELHQVAYLDPFVRTADAYLAITGRAWFQSVAFGELRHWAPRMIHVDLAVDRGDFPPLERELAPAGRRRFLYIGHTGWYKNTGYLSAIAQALPAGQVGWMGNGDGIPGTVAHGARDTAAPDTRELLATYDFLLTVGRADANPTTVLEAMSWGLVPVCTPTSGYVDEPGVVNVPLDDVAGALAVLRRLQLAPVEELESYRAANEARLRQHFTWDRLAGQVQAAVEELSGTAAQSPVPPVSRAVLRAATVTPSPYSSLAETGKRLALDVTYNRARAVPGLLRDRLAARRDRRSRS